MASQETAAYSAEKEVKKPLKRRAYETALNSDRGHKIVHGLIDRIFEHGPNRLFTWYGRENIDALRDHIERGEKVVLIVNHRSHGDAVPVTKLATEVRDLVPGAIDDVVYTMAGSMREQQGLLVKTLFVHGVEPYFKKVGVTPDYVVSKNDREERKMQRPDGNGHVTREEMRNPRTISVVHLPGHTKEGKINPETNEPFGLQEADRGFRAILLQQYDSGIPTVLLPVVVDGINEIFSPDNKAFSWSGVNTLFEMLTVGEGTRVGNAIDAVSRLWFGDAMRYKPATITIGEPKPLAELYTRVFEFGDNITRELAKLTSSKYLGDYGRKLLSK